MLISLFMTDTATEKEYEWSRDILLGLKHPFVALIGNHDFLGTGDQTFKEMYGKFDFSFIAGRVKFICLNTNAVEYDYLAAVPNFDFLEEQLSVDTDVPLSSCTQHLTATNSTTMLARHSVVISTLLPV